MEKYKRQNTGPVIEGIASVLATAKKYELAIINITKSIRSYNQDGMAG